MAASLIGAANAVVSFRLAPEELAHVPVPSALLGLIESRKATHAFFVPAVVDMLLADPARGVGAREPMSRTD